MSTDSAEQMVRQVAEALHEDLAGPKWVDFCENMASWFYASASQERVEIDEDKHLRQY